MESAELALHLLSEHGLGVYSLGQRDQLIHDALHHPANSPDHNHALPNVIPGCLYEDVVRRQMMGES